MEPGAKKNKISFLEKGGELGELIRNFDWAKTAVGAPEQWPQSLRLTVSMILSSKFPMFLWWGEELIQFYNDAYRPSLGNSGKHPAAGGQKGKDCWPEIWDFIYPLIEQVRSTGEATWNEDQLLPIFRNGKMEDVYWTFSYSPIPGESGNIDGVLVVCSETTEKVKNKRALEESEERLRSVVRSAPFPIGVYTGREMRVEIANQAMLDAWGKGNEVTGRLYSEILPELGNQEIFAQLDEVYTSGIPVHRRNQRVDIVVDGRLQTFYFNYSFTPLFGADGKISGVMNTAAEVTDLNLAKQKVEQSEKNFRNMILQAPVAMCILLGPEHIVEVANEKMIALWGKRPEEVMRKPVFEGLPEAKEQGLEQLMANVYQTGETFKANERPVSLFRNGKVEMVYQDFVYEPYRNPDGTILGILAISIDVTEQVLARQKIQEVVAERTKELASANFSLQKSNAELAQFAYIASHDLQEPLRKIGTFAQMLENRVGDQLDEQAKSYLDKINNSSARMHTLIRDVLSYSELVKESEVYLPVNLQQVLESCLTDYELLIQQKDASVQFENLPVIEAIPLQMGQLFGNIISNSLKFTRPAVKAVLRIEAAALDEKEKSKLALDPALEYCKVRFSDNGIGFKPEHAEQIFNIFQRLHRKSEYEGTGIGLAMCKKIALNHHGDMNALGSSEQGAVFNVYLPLKQEKK